MQLETGRLATIWGGATGRIAAVETAPDPYTDYPIDWVSVELSTGVQWYPAWQITSTFQTVSGGDMVPPRFISGVTVERKEASE